MNNHEFQVAINDYIPVITTELFTYRNFKQ